MGNRLASRLGAFIRRVWKNALIGGVSFWLLDVIRYGLDWVAKRDSSFLEDRILTIAMPLTALAVYSIVQKRSKDSKQSVALTMAFGIWILGPTMMEVGQIISGAGFPSNIPLELALIIFATVIPIYTVIMTAYDGTTFALILITIALIALDHAYKKKHGLLRHVGQPSDLPLNSKEQQA